MGNLGCSILFLVLLFLSGFTRDFAYGVTFYIKLDFAPSYRPFLVGFLDTEYTCVQPTESNNR